MPRPRALTLAAAAGPRLAVAAPAGRRRRRPTGGGLLQDPHLPIPAGVVLEVGAPGDDARRQARGLDPPGRDLPGREARSATTPKEVEVHPVRPRPARGPRPGLPRRLALRHPARRAVPAQGHRRRRRADVFETVSDAWEINGDYHEYAFGSKFDRDGNLWVALCLTGSFTSENKFRGWALRVTPDGKVDPRPARASARPAAWG